MDNSQTNTNVKPVLCPECKADKFFIIEHIIWDLADYGDKDAVYAVDSEGDFDHAECENGHKFTYEQFTALFPGRTLEWN